VEGKDLADLGKAVLPPLIWAIFGTLLLWYFGKEIRSALGALGERVRRGDDVDLGGIKLKSSAAQLPANEAGALAPPSEKAVSTLADERLGLYKRFRRLMLVNRFYPPTVPGQDFDVVLLIHAHKGSDQPAGSLDDIERVEYFLGPSWNNRVFSSTEADQHFAVRVSAYGSFVCVCRIKFRNSDSQEIQYRYIDGSSWRTTSKTSA
jgi:hypothetical protein